MSDSLYVPRPGADEQGRWRKGCGVSEPKWSRAWWKTELRLWWETFWPPLRSWESKMDYYERVRIHRGWMRDFDEDELEIVQEWLHRKPTDRGGYWWGGKEAAVARLFDLRPESWTGPEDDFPDQRETDFETVTEWLARSANRATRRNGSSPARLGTRNGRCRSD